MSSSGCSDIDDQGMDLGDIELSSTGRLLHAMTASQKDDEGTLETYMKISK